MVGSREMVENARLWRAGLLVSWKNSNSLRVGERESEGGGFGEEVVLEGHHVTQRH